MTIPTHLPIWIKDNAYSFFPPRQQSDSPAQLSPKLVNLAVVHHSYSPDTWTAADCAHVAKQKGWLGDYHFVIHPDGLVETGTRFPDRGTHAYGVNSRSIGICLIGNFERKMPTDAQIAGLYRVLQMLEQLGFSFNIEPHSRIAEIVGDHKAATACPGDDLRANWGFIANGYKKFKAASLADPFPQSSGPNRLTERSSCPNIIVNASIRDVQKALVNAGFSVGACGIDDLWGVGTLNAVLAFQRSRHLTVDGIVGQKTWSMLAPFLKARLLPEMTTRNIQSALKKAGFNPGPIDGAYGPLTQAAVKAFQAAHPPLVVDGDCGHNTWAVLGMAL